jgi:transcriptional regulator with XRE-family HTH domain
MSRHKKEEHPSGQRLREIMAQYQSKDLPGEIARLCAGLRTDQKGLGELLSVSGATISDWLRGKFNPSAESLILLGNLAHGQQAIYFWTLAGIEPERIMAAVGTVMAARLPTNVAWPGESNIPPELIAAFPELEWKNETSLAFAAEMLRLEPKEIAALIESGKIKARRVHPKGSYIVDVPSAMDYWVKVRGDEVSRDMSLKMQPSDPPKNLNESSRKKTPRKK